MMSTCLPHHMWMAKPGLAPIDVYIGRLDWIWSLCIWMWIGAGKCPTPLRRSYTAHTMESHYRSRVAWKTWTGFSKNGLDFRKKWIKIWKIIKKSPMSIATYRHGALLPPSVDFDVLAGSQLNWLATLRCSVISESPICCDRQVARYYENLRHLPWVTLEECVC